MLNRPNCECEEKGTEGGSKSVAVNTSFTCILLNNEDEG